MLLQARTPRPRRATRGYWTGKGGDTNLLPCDSGGGRGDAATGVTRRRWRGQSAELLYQGADKPVPEFISHNDQICGGGGAACQRGAATCWNDRDAPSPWPGEMLGQRGTAREPGQASPPSCLTTHRRCPAPCHLIFTSPPSCLLTHHPSPAPVQHFHHFSTFMSAHPSSLSCPLVTCSSLLHLRV